jgi:predicted transport protein
MSTLEEQTANQIANIEASTGRGLADWIAIIHGSGIEKHGQAVAMLKSEYGLGHGNANLLVLKAREAQAGRAAAEEDLVAGHYSGRHATLRPMYEAVIEAVRTFGTDIELAPKKTYVSLRRRKQFGQVGPAAGRLEVGVNLPGHPATDRLKPMSGMASHRVRLAAGDRIDDELIGWLREAYDRA